MFLEQQGEEVTWYLYRIGSDGKKIPPSFEGEPSYALRFTGKFDIERVAEAVGGGFFEVMGRTKTAILPRMKIAIEGAPRFVRPATIDPPPATAAGSPELLRLEQRLDQLARVLEARPAAQPPQSITDLLAIAREMRVAAAESAPAPPAPAQSATTLIDASTQLLDLAERLAERGSVQSSPVASVLKETLPRVLTLLERLPFLSGRPADPASSSAPAPATAPDGNVLVSMLVRALANGRAADDAADATETILSASELAGIRAADVELVLQQIRPTLAANNLATPEAETWVRTWHQELRNPPPPGGAGTAG